MNVPEIVTARITEIMEKGEIPWHRPWFSISPAAYNYATGRRYSLLNCLLLDRPGGYLTFDQAKKFGGIEKGAKARIVVFWKPAEAEENEAVDNGNENGKVKESEKEDEDQKKKFVLRYYHVYHTSQVRNLKDLPGTVPDCVFENDMKAEDVIGNFLTLENITLEQEPSNRAYYCPSSDTIHMPAMGQFRNRNMYYGTFLHECSHATGAETRLAREGVLDVNFGSDPYAKEELIAELSSAIVLHTLGLSTDDCIENSAAYIQGWSKQLKEDPRLIVSACTHAHRAASFILDCSQFSDEAGKTVSLPQ